MPGSSVNNNNIAYVFDSGSSHNTGFGIGFDQAHGFMAGAGGRIGGYYTNTGMTPGNPVGNANQWYHLAVSRSGSAVRLYIDGQLINTINVVSPNITTGQPFAIGREAKANQRN